MIRGGKCTEAMRPIKVTLDGTPLVGECRYKNNAGVQGSFVTHPTDATLSILGQGFVKEAGSSLCPSAYLLEASMTMRTDKATAEPLYIS